ncbi:uncharacterized protein PADG_11278 [Paracoccidioides brasiliensis Pb18]|uniref:Uncharacterized protein n=1 Tax=Paracoccidioides brasiliensis (strain Pb18) TaxID=502780 RepID=A0A0A0HWK7_PARBD|nr:uncharacterized protein PADG_11278 [Paracoccidioides brasiliensis Pb18]KGM92461.1 hypothetical protein PADG_11278 [Paracoccidioides brasiliensis Pb18]
MFLKTKPPGGRTTSRDVRVYQSLRSQSTPQGSFPPVYEEEHDQVPEPSSADEGETEYALAEEAIEEASSSCDLRKRPARHELDDETPSPMSTTIPTPTSNASGMITMTAADLFAFCQQMMAIQQNTQINENAPAYTLKQEIREYQKEVQAVMDMKAVTTFNGTNYQD